MADVKLIDMVATTTPCASDILYLVSDPGGTPVDRKVTLANTITKAHGLIGANYLLMLGASNDMQATNVLYISTINLPSTSGAPATTAGQIKHNTDAGSATNSGLLQWYDGTAVRSLVDIGNNATFVVRTEFIPVTWMDDTGTNNPEPRAVLSTTSNSREFTVRKFAGTTQNDQLSFGWLAPQELDASAGVKFRTVLFVSETTAPSSETIEFELSGVSLGDNDAGGFASYGASQNSVWPAGSAAANDMLFGPWSSAITVTDLAAGEWVHFLLVRDQANDTYGQKIGVLGIELKYLATLKGAASF